MVDVLNPEFTFGLKLTVTLNSNGSGELYRSLAYTTKALMLSAFDGGPALSQLEFSKRCLNKKRPTDYEVVG